METATKDTRKNRYPYIPLRLDPDVLKQVDVERERRFGLTRQEFLRDAILRILPISRELPGRETP